MTMIAIDASTSSTTSWYLPLPPFFAGVFSFMTVISFLTDAQCGNAERASRYLAIALLLEPQAPERDPESGSLIRAFL
jgi:hypothetical protein